jgi:hypothetical protein
MGKPWTAEEDGAVIANWRNWPALVTALPERTRDAIGSRGTKLGLRVPKRQQHFWTRTEEREILVDWEERDWTTLRAKYPWATGNAVRTRVRRLRAAGAVAGPRRPFPPTDNVIVDAVLAEVLRQGLSLRDLDRRAGTGTYFRRTGGRGCDDLILVKAIRSLGGELWVEWPVEQSA